MKTQTTETNSCGRDIPPSTLLRWCKFNLVGGIGIGVQFAALFLVKGVMHFNYLAATAISVEATVVHNFVWHEQFTWVDRTMPDRTKSGCNQPRWRRSLPRLLRFNLTNGAVSILGNLALMKVMVGQAHVNYLLANAIAITLCSLANFLVSETWVFEKSSSEKHPVILSGAERFMK
jgi:putative flippase GtrA